jgi:hypothetical protein
MSEGTAATVRWPGDIVPLLLYLPLVMGGIKKDRVETV